MSFNPNAPVAGDPILKSQRQLKANFTAIQNAFSENHVNFNDNQQGFHTFLNLLSQSGNPTTSADETAIYNKFISGIPNLFFAPNNSQTPIQLTYPSFLADSSNAQYSFMAGPFVIYGGLISNPSIGQLVTLTPNTTLIYAGLVITNLRNPGKLFLPYAAAATSLTGNTFRISYSNTLRGTFDVYYLAIGK